MKAKKSLGQNFLSSMPIAKKMISTAEVGANDTILEIGPGKGAITKLLLSQAKQVVAVEKDGELVRVLAEKFAKEREAGKLILVEEDILLFNEEGNEHLRGGYKIVANIPYYITGAILKKFLSSQNQPESITLLVQKEIADRIVARDDKESILSISVKAYGAPHYAGKVGKANFSPAPRVDSAILHIDNISRNNFQSPEEEELFFEIVKAGFSHKRKKLLKNLQNNFGKKIEQCFSQLSFDKNIRAETLGVEEWLLLVREMEKEINMV